MLIMFQTENFITLDQNDQNEFSSILLFNSTTTNDVIYCGGWRKAKKIQKWIQREGVWAPPNLVLKKDDRHNKVMSF